jgi:hypothetical protein
VPTRKQRRRREKAFRHEYGYVLTDEEGNEVEVDPAELRAAKEKEAPKSKPKQRGSGSRRPVREVQPPSWRRSLRRGSLMGGLMLVVVIAFFKNMSLPARILVGLVYALAFIPFTYMIDRIAYRNYLRRSGKT